MPLTRAVRRHPEFRAGIQSMLPQVTGLAIWGLMAGVAMAKSGLSVVEALAMALLVYAGSAQLASLPLLMAGAPAWIVLATAFCVNLRFVVFSLHLRDYMMHLSRARRLMAGYFTTDMGYVLLTRRYPEAASDAPGQLAREAFLLGSSAIAWIAWVVASVAGVVLANFIPTHWGLEFAGILCLVGLTYSMATTRLRLLAAAIGGLTAVAAYSLPFKLNILLAIGVAMVACVALQRHPLLREARP